MKPQQIFDTVKAHLLTQNRQAFVKERGDERCVYLDPNGNKCAIGCLIPDGHPAQQFRGSLGPLLKTYPDLKKEWECSIVLLFELQCVHDEHSPESWPRELKTVAEHYSLTP